MPAYGKVHRGIWNDPEFRQLTPQSKLLYIHFVSHPRLNKVGALDIHEDRWGRAIGVDDVAPFVDELEAARFVVLDRETEEMVIRTYVKNDGFVGNWKMLCAMWRAWEGVESEALRTVIVVNMPDEVWISRNATPPPMAQIVKAQVERQSIGNAIGNRLPIESQSDWQSPPPTAPATAPVTVNPCQSPSEPSATDATTPAQVATNIAAIRSIRGGAA